MSALLSPVLLLLLSLWSAGSLGCSDPPHTALCLRSPTSTPSSSFLRTRKRLVLLITPSRRIGSGRARRGDRQGGQGTRGGVRPRSDRPAAVPVGERWAPPPPGITARR
ncbi:hypothetical protein ATANTOWER_027125 [Ataeniobius toweri]|nr:hypothetical protein [Ataeniobius toweri]